MRRKISVSQNGPYHVESCADGTLIVYPAWTREGNWDLEQGGGPGITSRMHLAGCVEELLNNCPSDNSASGLAERDSKRRFVRKYGRLNVVEAPHNTLKATRIKGPKSAEEE